MCSGSVGECARGHVCLFAFFIIIIIYIIINNYYLL